MATKKISQLTLATGVTGADLVPIVQGGVTKRALVSSLGGIGATGPTGPAGAGEAYVTGTAPAAASEGATWFDTDDGKYYTRYSGLWVEVGGKHYP
jgi:hypothetical protein